MIRLWVKRILIGSGLLLVVGIIAAFGFRFYHMHQAQKELDAAIAATDQLDPNWRWDNIIAKWKERDNLKPEENSITYIMKAYELLPKDWPRVRAGKVEQNNNSEIENKTLWEMILEHSPAERLPTTLNLDLKSELSALQPVLAAAGKLRNCPRGFYPIKFEKNLMATLLPHFQPCRTIADVFVLKACFLADEGQLAEAWKQLQPIRNASQAVHGEPLLIGMLFELAIRGVHDRVAERILAQGEIPDSDLEVVQKGILLGLSQPLIKEGLRSERAYMSEMAEMLRSGEVDLQELGGGPPSSGLERWYNTIVISPIANYGQAKILEFFNQALNVLEERPTSEWMDYLESVELQVKRIRSKTAEGDYRYVLAYSLFPGVGKVAIAELRQRAFDTVTMAGIAAERYRLKNKRWPKKWEDLVPQYLGELPTDPFRNSPLVLKPEENGLTIYSVGSDRVDNGGTIDRANQTIKDTDIVFRLWNPQARNQLGRIEPKDGTIEK